MVMTMLRLFGMALESDHSCHVLLTGPPASAKTLFLQSLMKLKDSHFIAVMPLNFTVTPKIVESFLRGLVLYIAH